MKAAIIAGGLGTRIRSRSGESIPKALVPVAGEPIIFRQLSLLNRFGISHIIILAGHLGTILQQQVQSHPWAKKLKIEFAIEQEPLGTAGGLLNARSFFQKDDFLAIYGDIAVEMDLDRLIGFHRNKGSAATIVCHPNNHPQSSDLLRENPPDQVQAILPSKGRAPGNYRNLVPAGVYVFSQDIFDFISPQPPQDFIYDVFPRMLKTGQIIALYNTTEYLRDMGSPARFDMVEKDIASGLMAKMNGIHKRPVIFFDLDGVVNADVPGRGITKPEEVKLLPRAAEAIGLVNETGWLAVAVTNRPQLAKGFINLLELESIHGRLEMELGAHGAWLDRIYYCPHHPKKGFEGEVPELKVVCDCRKPQIGLMERAFLELPADRQNAYMIGDSDRDMDAGKALKIPSYGVRTGNACQGTSPDVLFDNVYDAVHFAIFEAKRMKP